MTVINFPLPKRIPVQPNSFVTILPIHRDVRSQFAAMVVERNSPNYPGWLLNDCSVMPCDVETDLDRSGR